MGIIKRLSDAVRGTKTQQVAYQEQSGHFMLSSICSTYENIFPQVRPLIDALKSVHPYGVGRNGAKLPATRTPELFILEDPNEQMGWSEFMDLAFAMWLTESELNIRVWKDGRGRVYGYTILPLGSRVDLGNGNYYFRSKDADGLTEDIPKEDVMTLRYSRNPQDFSKGVSPAQTVFVQTQIMDLMYQYERAFLENGAVPAYITIIRASSEEKFEETKRTLEQGFKGADKKGKTLYIYRRFNNDTGKDLDQVEIKTIQPNNSTLAIKEIMSIVKDDFNKAFGVSEFILGNDSSAKYDNAELSQQQFMLRRVKPALESFWSQFQHEIDRVTGGVGYAINYELDIPELTDRLKVKAEIAEKNVANLSNLIKAGSTPRAAVLALGLDDNWLEVAHGIFDEKTKQAALAAQAGAITATNGAITGQVSDITTSVDNKKIGQYPDKSGAITHVCHHHCGHTHDAKTAKEYVVEFAKEEVTKKAIYEELEKVLESALAEVLGEGDVLTEEEIEKVCEKIVEELSKQADLGANSAATSIKGFVLGKTAEEIANVLENGGYHVGKDFTKKLYKRVDELTIRLSADAKYAAEEFLKTKRAEGYTAQEIKKGLSTIMPRARAESIARNETVYAYRAGGLDNAKYMSDKYGITIKKTWRAHEGACPICAAMDGQTVDLETVFPDSVNGKDGTTYAWEHTKWNDKGELADAHVNCRCYIEYEVVDG